MAKIIIDLSDEDKRLIDTAFSRNSEYTMTQLLKIADRALDSIRRGTVLPDDATNGDVIKLMFPNAQIEHNGECVGIVYEKTARTTTYDVSFSTEWWNAPYKRGDIT